MRSNQNRVAREIKIGAEQEAGLDGLTVTALRAVGNFIKRLRGGEKNDDEPPRSQRNAWLG